MGLYTRLYSMCDGVIFEVVLHNALQYKILNQMGFRKPIRNTPPDVRTENRGVETRSKKKYSVS